MENEFPPLPRPKPPRCKYIEPEGIKYAQEVFLDLGPDASPEMHRVTDAMRNFCAKDGPIRCLTHTGEMYTYKRASDDEIGELLKEDAFDRMKRELNEKTRELQKKRDDALASRPYNVIGISDMPRAHEFGILTVKNLDA